jgi:hypothetical protein
MQAHQREFPSFDDEDDSSPGFRRTHSSRELLWGLTHEINVPSDRAEELWWALIEAGKEFGVEPY